MYVLRRGFRFRLVCFQASHTVSSPKPRVNPMAMEASLMSVVVADMLGEEATG